MPGFGEMNGFHPRSSVDITNRSDGPMTLYVEPWGDEFELQPSEGLRVDVLAPTERVNTHLLQRQLGHGRRLGRRAVAEVWKGNERLN